MVFGNMNKEIDRDREIIHCIYHLLPTIDEGFTYMDDQFAVLEFEKSITVFQDIVNAIKSISVNLLVLEIEDSHVLVELMKKLRKSIVYVARVCENGELSGMKTLVDQMLIPHYDEWKQEVLRLLSGKQFVYLQN